MDKKFITSIDLELNQPSNKIISIGVVIGDLETGKIIDEKQWFVKIDEPLCIDPSICDIPKLTGITEELLAEKGIDLIDAYNQLVQFHDRSDFMNPLTWGAGDSRALRSDLERLEHKFSGGFHNPNKLPVFCFGHRTFDCKQRFQEQCILESKSLQSGLKKALKRCGLSFQGRPHEALSDARNTFLLYYYLLFSHKFGTVRQGKRRS